MGRPGLAPDAASIQWPDTLIIVPGVGNAPISVQGGRIDMECITKETVKRHSVVTKHPIESGGFVSDYYYPDPIEITLEGVISNTPVDEGLYAAKGGTFSAAVLNLKPYPDVSLLAFGATLVINPIGSLIRALRSPPTSIVVNALQWPLQFDAIGDFYAAVDQLRNNAILVNVVTKQGVYGNMAITDVVGDRDKDVGDAAKIRIELQEVRMISTQQVPAPPIPLKPKDAPIVAKGVQVPKDPGSMTSVAKQMVTGIQNYFAGGGA